MYRSWSKGCEGYLGCTGPGKGCKGYLGCTGPGEQDVRGTLGVQVLKQGMGCEGYLEQGV